MSDEINDKTVALCVNGGKISARILRRALQEMLRQLEKNDRRRQAKYIRPQGKQTMKDLQGQDRELTNIQITDKNIRSFERFARKYGVDYALKKDAQEQPPRYYVFFKARDVETMKAAFKEYTRFELNKEKKPSIRKSLKRMMERAAKQQEREKTKQKDRSEAR